MSLPMLWQGDLPDEDETFEAALDEAARGEVERRLRLVGELEDAADPTAVWPNEPGYDPDEAARRVLERKDGEAVEIERRRRRARRVVDDEERPPFRPVRAELLAADALADLAPPAMRVAELIPARAVGFLNGRSGSYKSFVLVALAHAIATGRPMLGRFEVRQPGRVLYVAAEGAAGVALRLRAAQARWGACEPGTLALLPRAVDLGDTRAVADVYGTAAADGFTDVFVDTFRQATPGLAEIDNTAVGTVLARALAARDEHGISTLYADHTGHAGDRAVGAEAKWASSDYALMTKMPTADRANDQQRRLRVEKLKDQPAGGEWPLRLVAVPSVVDADGQQSAVVEIGEVGMPFGDLGTEDWRTVRLPDDVVDFRGERRGDLLKVARLVLAFGRGESGVSRAEVVRYVGEDDPRTRDTVRKAAVRGWDALHALGRLEPVSVHSASPSGAHRWVRKPGDVDL